MASTTTGSMRAFITPNLEALNELLRGLTYRPGWRFEIESDVLVIKAEVVDTDNHERLIPLQFGIGLPTFTVHDNFNWTRWLFDQIMEVERHEAQEFFKVNGVKVYDPHA